MCVCVSVFNFRSNSLSDAANQLKNISRAPYQTRPSLSPSIVKEEEDRERGFQRKISSTESLTT